MNKLSEWLDENENEQRGSGRFRVFILVLVAAMLIAGLKLDSGFQVLWSEQIAANYPAKSTLMKTQTFVQMMKVRDVILRPSADSRHGCYHLGHQFVATKYCCDIGDG
jgi:hypothetical protein